MKITKQTRGLLELILTLIEIFSLKALSTSHTTLTINRMICLATYLEELFSTFHPSLAEIVRQAGGAGLAAHQRGQAAERHHLRHGRQK